MHRRPGTVRLSDRAIAAEATNMIASATTELRLVIPAWGCVILMAVGMIYLVLGSWWPRLFTVFSMTVLGCVAGLMASPWVPLAQPLVIVAGGLVLGGLTAFFKDVAHAVLASVVLASVLATLTALAVGQTGFTSYLVLNLSDRSYSTQVRGPNLACDPVLAAGVTGLLVGATLAVAWTTVSQRVITSAQGAGMILCGLVELVNAYRGEGRTSLALEFPLTLSAFWLCLVAIGLVVQRTLSRPEESWEGGAGDAEDA